MSQCALVVHLVVTEPKDILRMLGGRAQFGGLVQRMAPLRVTDIEAGANVARPPRVEDYLTCTRNSRLSPIRAIAYCRLRPRGDRDLGADLGASG